MATRKSLKNIVVVSPDHGGVNRARILAEMFNCSLAIIDKRRNSNLEPEVMNIIGDVKGKECYIIDDIIDTARSAVVGCKALREAGATKINFVGVHPVLSDPAYELLLKHDFDQFIVTDSIPLPERFKKLGTIKVISLAPMLAEIIRRIEENRPLSVVYEMYGGPETKE